MQAGALYLLLQVGASLQQAADSSALRHADGRVPGSVTAVRVARPPALDGQLDDEAWLLAPPLTELRQFDPEEGKPVTERTEIRVVYDEDALYVGARLFDREPARIARQLGRRDSDTRSDDFRVLIDSYHDHRTAFRFDVNPLGVKRDLVFGDDGNFSDDSWDPVWDAATSIDSLGWTAEIRIPFSQLRFSRAPEQVWGIRFVRTILRKNEFSFFPFVGKTESGFVSRFAHLVGLRHIPAPRRLELLPYTVGRGTYHRQDNPSHPFDDGSVYFGGAGLDLKYGVTSNLTLDATINPDFGQVEADPAFVNLTAFELLFEERRPFFVEGANIFEFGPRGAFIQFGGTPRLFYSRRVGRPPALELEPPSDGYVDAPVNSTILGAAKLTGKTASGWSVGILNAVTARERATVDSAGARREEEVEPLTNYLVGRVKREFAGGRTVVGLIGTAVNRRIGAPALRGLRTAGYVAGADFLHRWANNAYLLMASAEIAHVTGDTLALQATQQASSRYYQRPDAERFRYDPSRTSLTGISADFSLNKEEGNLNWGIGLSTTTPGFESNDLGFQTRVDRISGGAFLGYRWTRPGKVFREASVGFSTGPSWNYDGDPIQRSFSINHFGLFRNFWGYSVFAIGLLEVYDDRLTRGGPLAREPASWGAGAFLFSNSRKRLTAELNTFYTREASGGWSLNAGPTLSFRPSAAVTVRLTPTYTAGRTTAQFVGPVSDATATATYGTRYLFGELDQQGVDVRLRLNVTMSPTFSFQLFAQPFTFAGDFSQFKELARARTFDFSVYGRDNGSTIAVDATTSAGLPTRYRVDPDGSGGPAAEYTFRNPDFRTRSLQSNAVLRWEYRPGSTVFVVWTQNRERFTRFDPDFAADRDLWRALLLDRPTNVLLVKLNYWISL